MEVEKELGLRSKQDIENLVSDDRFASIDRFVALCKERVDKFARIQTEQSIRLGYWMDWDQGEDWLKPPDERRSYFTMSEENNYTIWSFLKKCHERGLIYRAYDSMPWCPRCAVGISQMEMHEGYQRVAHRAVFVRFPLRGRPGENLLVWTTTPWTLTSNVAVAVNPALTYLRVRHRNEVYYLAKGTFTAQRLEEEFRRKEWVEGVPKLKSIEQIFKEKGGYEVLGELAGAEMLEWPYDGPFDKFEAQGDPGGFPAGIADVAVKQKWGPEKAAREIHRVIPWNAVSEAEGAGIVHIAPGCGKEDFALGKAEGLVPIAPLDETGIFLHGFGELEGRSALDPATIDWILGNLQHKGLLVAVEQYPHNYPHCWRCKTELLFRLVDEWFIDMRWRDAIMPSDEQLFTRDEALGGLPARRAATLLFLIESRSAQLEARSRLAAEEFPTEKAAQELDLAFLEAFASSREPPLRPTIQDLERHVPKWAHLIPENARLRATIAHLLSKKYSFSSQAVPGMRLALGLDEPAVQRAYQEFYKRSLNTIFVPRVTLIEWLRWVPTAVAKRLDSLPPFWTTFLLVITLSLPQAVLALPIATAGLGPLAGVGLLLFFGFFNMLTMACMAEAFGRNGSIRYGSAFTGQVVSDYMGKGGSLLLVSATIMRLFIGLMACYYGLSVTMAGLTSTPPGVWAVFLFLLALYLLLGKSLNFSTALSALLGAVSIALVLVISLAVLDDIQWANLSYVNVPLIGGRPFDHATLQVIFGIVIQSYLGHTYLTQCAKVVLPRDPGAASLLWGTAAASVGMTMRSGSNVFTSSTVCAPSIAIVTSNPARVSRRWSINRLSALSSTQRILVIVAAPL